MMPIYMIADVTRHGDLRHPFHPHVPFYIGMGPKTPSIDGTFIANGLEYKVVASFDGDFDLNPFFVDVVMAVRVI